MVKDRFTKKLWISAGIIVASIIVAALALNFFAGDLATQAQAIVNARTAIQDHTNAVANLAALQQQAPQAAQYESSINQLIPDQYGLVNFPQWFGRTGQQYGVTANAALQGSMSGAQGSSPGTAAFSFDVEGPLAGITSFLDYVNAQSSGFLLSTNSFDLTSDGTNDKVTGQGTVFFQ